jgi:hypothetical protein
MLQFPYLPRRLRPPAPPNLPATSHFRLRPIVPVTLIGPTNLRHRDQAVLDTGSDECLFPEIFLHVIGGMLRPETGYSITWRGTAYPIRYADISLMLADDASSYRWPATVAFTSAPLRYALLGTAGCLQYFDARFLGADRTVELEANWTYPGTK